MTMLTAFGRPGLFRYFSFETLTTLGYGDVLPTAPVSRSLASSEALFGQLYPAAMIARVISLELAAGRGARRPSPTAPWIEYAHGAVPSAQPARRIMKRYGDLRGAIRSESAARYLHAHDLCAPRTVDLDRRDHCTLHRDRLRRELSLDHRGHDELPTALGNAGHVARISLPLADSDVLVRAAACALWHQSSPIPLFGSRSCSFRWCGSGSARLGCGWSIECCAAGSRCAMDGGCTCESAVSGFSSGRVRGVSQSW